MEKIRIKYFDPELLISAENQTGLICAPVRLRS